MNTDFAPKTSTEDRAAALREYIETADDRAAAVALMLEILDAENDLRLIALLEEIAPEEFNHAASRDHATNQDHA